MMDVYDLGNKALIRHSIWWCLDLELPSLQNYEKHISIVYKLPHFFNFYWSIALGGSDGKNMPALWETWTQSLGQGDPLEKGRATHSRILAWRIHGQRSLVGYSPWGCKELDATE